MTADWFQGQPASPGHTPRITSRPCRPCRGDATQGSPAQHPHLVTRRHCLHLTGCPSTTQRDAAGALDSFRTHPTMSREVRRCCVAASGLRPGPALTWRQHCAPLGPGTRRCGASLALRGAGQHPLVSTRQTPGGPPPEGQPQGSLHVAKYPPQWASHLRYELLREVGG